MRLAIIFFILISLGFLLKSYCKAMCVDENIFSFLFQGFTSNELKKIKVFQYNPGNFTTATDSFYVATTNNVVVGDTTIVYLDKPLVNDFNFKIVVENAAVTYTLSDMQIVKDKCSCGPGTSEWIIGYKLNGVLKSDRP